MERTVVNPSRFKIAPSAFDRRVIRTLDHRWRSSRWQGQQAPKSKGMLRAALLKLDTLLYGVCFSDLLLVSSFRLELPFARLHEQLQHVGTEDALLLALLDCILYQQIEHEAFQGNQRRKATFMVSKFCPNFKILLLVSSFRLELPFARLHQQLQNIGSEDALLLTLLDGILYQRIEMFLHGARVGRSPDFTERGPRSVAGAWTARRPLFSRLTAKIASTC
ncbi:Protein of unknown function [Gryllus bimaculatus]|nr:Protein of unknown function [Gryllus bimaculatus]